MCMLASSFETATQKTWKTNQMKLQRHITFIRTKHKNRDTHRFLLGIACLGFLLLFRIQISVHFIFSAWPWQAGCLLQ